MANLKDLIVNGSARILGTLYAPDIKNTHRVTEFIVGTQTAATGAWTGKSEDTALYNGKSIHYFLPYAGSGNATLNLTLADGTTTGAKPIYREGTTYLTTRYPANSCIGMTYNEAKGAWFANADYNTNDNTFDRVKNPNTVKAAAACTGGKLIVGTSAGYKDVAASVTFDIDYPILYCGTTIAANATGTDTYLMIPSRNLQTTKASWTGTQYSEVFLVGTLSGKTFTIDSSVFTTTVPTAQDNKVYIPLGVLYSTYQLYFTPTRILYAYVNGSFQPIQPDLSGYVPTSRTVNGKALSGNVTLAASDVGAQATLVSGTNIKTVNSTSLLGSGNIAVQPTLVSGTNIKTVNGTSLLGSGDITVGGGGLPSQTGKAGLYLQTDGTDVSWEGVPGRNIGEIVSSTVPLTDAGLHLLDGALINGNGIYADFVDYIADLYDETPSYYDYHVNIIGSLTNNNGILSNFGLFNLAQIPTEVPFANATTFEFVVKFIYHTASANQTIFTENSDSYFSNIKTLSNGKIYMQLSNNHSSFLGEATGTTTLIDGTTYYVKFVYNGTAYKLYLSTTGDFNGEETEEASITSSVKQTNHLWNFGSCNNSEYNSPSVANEIDLKGCYININSLRWWTGADVTMPIFCKEYEWQNAVNTYGVCGKFVYTPASGNDPATVRLPKITGFTEGTIDPTLLGDLVEAGLPNITGSINSTVSWASNNPTTSGAISASKEGGCSIDSGSSESRQSLAFDASNSSSIYGNSTTVQPQTIKVLYYICIATSTKTEIQVDIDQVATDLNNKVDRSDLAEVQCVVETYVNGTSWYRIYSDGWCEQGGRFNANNTATTASYTVNLLKYYKDTNYSIVTCGYSNHADQFKNGVSPYSFTTSSFVIQTYNNDALQPIVWQASGYIEV